MGFSRQEYWSGLQFPSPGAHSDPGIVPVSSAWQADSLLLNHQRSPSKSIQGLINLPFPSLQNLDKEVSTSFEILKVLVCLGGKCSYFLSHLAKGQLGISCSPCKPLGNKSQLVNLPQNTVINQLQLLFFFFSKLQAERTMNSLWNQFSDLQQHSFFLNCNSIENIRVHWMKEDKELFHETSVLDMHARTPTKAD